MTITAVVVSVVAILLGAAVQSATGFGFSLVAAPILFVVMSPHEAVVLLFALGAEVNLLTVLAERRRPQVLGREALILTAWSLPGALAGAVALTVVPAKSLTVAVAVSVFVALGLRVRQSRRPVAPRAPNRWWRPGAGVTAGVLSTSTGTYGSPLLLYLMRAGATPDQVRDTMAVCFLIFLPSGVLAIASVGRLESPVEGWSAAGLFTAAAVGQWVGRRGFAILRNGRHERALEIVLAVCAAAALGAGLT